MYPRLPRLLRLGLLALCLLLSLLVVLRVGVGLQGSASPDLLRAHRLASWQTLQRPVPPLLMLSATRHPPSTVPKVRIVAQALRVNKTLPPTPTPTTTTVPKTSPAVKVVTDDAMTVKPADVVNPHPFRYIINPRDTCRTSRQGGRVDLLVYVHSAPANFKKRMAVRQTWGDKALLRGYNATLVFVVGRVPESAHMTLLQMESERFQDVVQEDFMDTYRNLSYKAIAGLKWAQQFCPGVAFILKTDDDILVNLPRVVRYLQEEVKPKLGSRRLILCNVWIRMRIIRDVRSKWYVSEKEMKGDVFSPYCSGSAFLLSGDMAGLLYRASLVTPFFWVDDYYITGALVQRLDIKHRSLNRAYLLNPGVAEAKFHNDTKKELFFFHLHKLLVMYRLWKQMTPGNLTVVAASPSPRSPHLPPPSAAHSVRPVPRAA